MFKFSLQKLKIASKQKNSTSKIFVKQFAVACARAWNGNREWESGMGMTVVGIIPPKHVTDTCFLLYMYSFLRKMVSAPQNGWDRCGPFQSKDPARQIVSMEVNGRVL